MIKLKQEIPNKHVKQDINMLEYPIWMQDEKLPSKIPEDKGFIWKDREGYIYRCGYKVPTKLDIIYLMYLLYKSQQLGWQEEIELSRYEILKACGYSSCRPADYERLEDSLERWKMVGIKFKGTFYDGKKYIALSFGVIDTWKLDENTKKIKVRFNKEWLMRIKNSSYFKYLNFDQVRALRSPLAMRLYEILIKSFQFRDEWTINAQKLAEKIPMKEKMVAHIIPKIKAAVNRINSKTTLTVKLEIERPKRGQAIFIFTRVKDLALGQNLIVERSYKDELPEKLNKLIELLPEKQREKKTIKNLIQKYLINEGEEYVKRNILYANEKVKKQSSYRVFLEKALKEDWAFEWWEDQISSLLERKELNNISGEEQKELELRKKVEEFFENLSVEEKEKLMSRAREELPEDLRDIDSFVRMQARLIVKREILSYEKN